MVSRIDETVFGELGHQRVYWFRVGSRDRRKPRDGLAAIGDHDVAFGVGQLDVAAEPCLDLAYPCGSIQCDYIMCVVVP